MNGPLLWIGAVLVIVGAALLALVSSRAIGVGARRRNHEVGSTLFLQVGVMFAVLLAFVFNEVWSEYNQAAEAVNVECSSLHEAAMLAESLPGGTGTPVVDAIVHYAERVAGVEWLKMARGESDHEASRDFVALVHQVARLDPPPAAGAVKDQMLGLLATAHASRETRFYQMVQLLPAPIWAILGGYSLILMAFVALAGTEERAAHAAFNAVFAACTVLVLLLIALLDQPFRGPLALSDADFLALIRRIHDWG